MLEENKKCKYNGGLSVCNFSFDRTNIQEIWLLTFKVHFNLVFYLIFNNILSFKYDKNATNQHFIKNQKFFLIPNLLSTPQQQQISRKIKMATPHNPLTLKSEQKQKILHTIIDKQIDKEKYLQGMYLQDIQVLKNKKQMLQSLLESRQSLVRNGSRLEDNWKYYHDETYKSKMNGSLLAESNLDQSYYQPNSAKKLHSIQKRLSNQSPIRKLNNSSKIITKNSLIDLKPSSPTHYNKIEQLQNQVSLIQSRLSQQSQQKISSSKNMKLNEKQKQKQKQKQKEDEITANLWLKIKQQEDAKLKEFQRQRLLQIKRMYAKQIKSKIDKVKEEIFKNSKTLNIVQRDLINRNKDIIKGGYTRKMLELIQSYAGSRRA